MPHWIQYQQILWFYSVAVITSGSDPSFFTEACLDCPGDPGSIPGRTSSFCMILACWMYPFCHLAEGALCKKSK